MTDPAVKIASVSCLLLAGLCAAMLFQSRQPGPVPLPLQTVGDMPLCIPGESVPQKTPAAAETVGSSFAPSPTVVIPRHGYATPPPLSSSYPEGSQATRFEKTMPLARMLPVEKPVDLSGCRHVIVDGDTLESLASRYLGDAARAGEIFEANREVLQDPKLLPIGVELRIQSGNRP